MHKILIIIYLLVSPILVFAQDIQKIDDDTALVTPPPITQKASELKARYNALKAEKDRWDSVYQPQLDDIQKQLDALSRAGVDGMVNTNTETNTETNTSTETSTTTL